MFDRLKDLNKQFCLAFLFGFMFGLTVAYVTMYSEIFVLRPNLPSLQLVQGDCRRTPDERVDEFHKTENRSVGDLLLKKDGPVRDVGSHHHDDEFHKMENRTVAESLFKEVRVLCWVMTGPENHQTKAKHVKATWGRRCNKLLFMSSVKDKSLPTVALKVGEGRDNLWGKTKAAFKYVYENHLEEADWFLKADDDTYVIVENLRYMLHAHNSSDPVYFGCRFRPYTKQGYMSGGAGYVLSKEAVKRFVELALPDTAICRESDSGAEDVEIGVCLQAVGVAAGDSRDSEGRGRFFPFTVESFLIPGHMTPDFWYWQFSYYNFTTGMECCSDNAVTFHYISPNEMYVLEYLIYHLRPYGISYNFEIESERNEDLDLDTM